MRRPKMKPVDPEPATLYTYFIVSRNGEHLFATDHTRYHYSKQQIKSLSLLFSQAFPSTEGYSVVTLKAPR